jgi:DNA-binding NarL/FixJ family response regulator
VSPRDATYRSNAMSEKSSCVLLADRHHGLRDSVRGLLEAAFDSVFMVADEAALLEGARRLTPAVVVFDLS